MGAEEGLLGHLLGLGGVAEHPHRHPEHAMLVRDHQLLEGGGLAGAQPVQEARRVACLRLSHGKTIPRRGKFPRRNAGGRRAGRAPESACGRLRGIMTKRERVLPPVPPRPVDRPPLSFWRHVPDVDHTAAGLAEAMLAFQRRWDLDFVKVMSSGVYCVEDWGCRVAYQGSPNGAKQCTEHAVQEPRRLGADPRPLDPGAGALGRELEAVRLIARGRADDAPILHTAVLAAHGGPQAGGRSAGRGPARGARRGGARARRHHRDDGAPRAGRARRGRRRALLRHPDRRPDVVTAEESARFDLPRMRRILDAVAGRSALTLLHVHGRDVYFDQAAALPVHAMNWHDRLTTPRLGDGHRRFAGAVVGGLSEHRTLQAGPPDAVAAEVRDAHRPDRRPRRDHRAGLRAAARHAGRAPGRGGGGGEVGRMRKAGARRAGRGARCALLLRRWARPLRCAQSPGELRVALPWTPENLDPTMNLSSIRAKVGVGIFDSLVGRDADNKLAPQLAESWKALDDLTLQLKLRRGVVFHNGEPFNAEAVRFTFERVLDPNQKSPNRANVGEVARVEVVDDHTVNLVLRQPYAPAAEPPHRLPDRAPPSTPRRRATRAWPCARWARAHSSSWSWSRTTT